MAEYEVVEYNSPYFLLDLFDEDLPPDDDLNCHPNLYNNGELMDTVDFMNL